MDITRRVREIGNKTRPSNLGEAFLYCSAMFLAILCIITCFYLMVCLVVPSLILSETGWLGVLKLSGMIGMALLLMSFLTMIEPEDSANT